MSLPNDIISLLRDEAYLTLCRQSLDGALKDIAAHKEEVASTRPPFGILAAPSRCKTFEHTMRTVLDNESSLGSRLARIDTLEHWLHSTLHTKLHYFLWEASLDYRYSADVLTAIDVWERWVNPYGDHLLALARELKNAARILAGAKENAHTAFDSRAGTMADLHFAAENLDRSAWELEAAANNLSATVTNTIYDKVSVIAPPFADIGHWLDALAPLSNAEALNTVQAREGEVRSLLANKLLPLHARAEAAREAVAAAGSHYLESYWDQLRHHARTHYVKDREVDEVLDELTERHVAATRQRGEQIMRNKVDLYSHER